MQEQGLNPALNRAAVDLPIAHIVPHAGRMSLLTRAIEGDAESFVAEVAVTTGGLFEPLGAWVGIEYMAQTVAAWAGWRARLRGAEPRIGFLLGSRRYVSSQASFASGQTLRIEIRRVFLADNGLGQFDCRIERGPETIATAALTVYEPKGDAPFLKSGAAASDDGE
jgi:predicted hotdog family 3-hydroxylacyl-ACP dehydratase